MFTRLIISLSPKCCKKTKVKNARIEGAFLKRLNIQFDIQFVETLKNQGTNYPTAACEGFALVTAVFLWWNEVKQNIPTLRVFSQKKISIIRFFCGRSLFLKGKSETQILNRRSSYEKPTQTSCTIYIYIYIPKGQQRFPSKSPSCHPLFGSASLGDPLLWERIPYQERVAVSACMIRGWTIHAAMLNDGTRIFLD